MTHRLVSRLVVGVAIVVSVVLVGSAQAPQTGAAAKVVPTVALKALAALVPDVAGWEKVRTGGNQVTVSSTCGYTFADASFTKGEMKVRLTLADTGFSPDAIDILAALITSFPENHVSTIKPATTITRFKMAENQAASRWDGEKLDGEVTVLVGGRFIASAEGSNLDTIDTLKSFVTGIDLKKLGELK
jgi:hypothetical protein